MGITEQNRRWFILAAMGSTLGLIVLDQTVVGVALPTIRKALGMSQVGSHWIVNAYLLMLTGFAAAAGRMADIVPIQRIYITGAMLFGAASLSCGLAENSSWIIASRAVQGLGAAMVFPTSLAMITHAFPPEQRGLAFGIQTMIGGSFMSLGPLVGGALIHYASWRWIFWINLPVVLAIVFIVARAWRNVANESIKERIDVAGLVTLIVGLVALIAATMQGEDWGWRSLEILSLYGVAAVSLSVFVFLELKRSQPLLDLHLLRKGVITASNLVIFTGQFNQIAVTIFFALYLQTKLGLSALQTGTALLAAVVPTLVTSILAGHLSDRFGPRWPALIGLAANGSSLLWISVLVGDDRYGLLIAPLILYGLSLPFLVVPTRRAIMAAVESSKQGQASGVSMTLQLFGGSVGVAVCGAILAVTGSFRAIYLIAAAMAAVIWLIGFAAIRESKQATT